MKKHIVAIRDIVADNYDNPLFVDHLGSAIREFGDICQKDDNKYGQHPEDYELWLLGEWDSNTANFDTEHDGSHTQAKQLAIGKNFKKGGN